MQKAAFRAAQKFREGHSRVVYRPRGTILAGMNSHEAGQSDKGGMCNHCESLLDLHSIFKSLVHTGRDLKRRRAGYAKTRDASYRDVKLQNKYLLRTVFDGKSNYLYHRDCIRCTFDVGTQQLARLRKVVQEQSSHPFLKVSKEKVCRYSDVVLPRSQCQCGCVHILREVLLPAETSRNVMATLGKDLTMLQVRLL